MQISTEQMNAIYGGAREVKWSRIDRPAGPVDVPAWCAGVHIEWLDDYGNPPSFRLKAHGRLRDWDGKTFTCVNGIYQAKHPDGRLEQYAHNGPVSLTKLGCFRRADGTIGKYRRFGPEWASEPGWGTISPKGVRSGHEPGEWTEAEFLATTPQAGFGGAITWVTMEDGREIALRGPWHVGAPEGYTETAYVDVDDQWFKDVQGSRPWYRGTGVGGLYITHDLAIRIISTFAPHLELAWVDYGYAKGIEPLKPEWDAPKVVMLDRAAA